VLHAGLIDPALPLLIGGAAAGAAAAGVLGSSVLLPRLKQLPERSLQLAGVRQRLLAQACTLLIDLRRSNAAPETSFLALKAFQYWKAARAWPQGPWCRVGTR
jgi:hypothetical protein